MQQIEVFADIGCPFTHVGLRAFVALRGEQGRAEPLLRVRSWPLEVVNGKPLTGSFLAPEITALQQGPAPDLFAGFDAATFPATTRPALISVAAAYRSGPEVGEAFSLAVREALWEHGRDIADPSVLAALRADLDVPDPISDDATSIDFDLAEGRRRAVIGSPHFFTTTGDFFCPALDISRDDEGRMQVAFDSEKFRHFVSAALG